MRKWLFYISLTLVSAATAMAQHESLERHFSTWKLRYSPDTVDSFYAQDTNLDAFHRFEPFHHNNLHAGMLAGNPGQAFRAFNYFSRSPLPDFIFRSPYTSYFTATDEVVYYNARKPFTRFDFRTGANGYEDVQGVFTINPTPFLNAGLKYRSIKTDGSFINSASKNKDFVLWQSYTGHRYQNHFNITASRQSSQEYGGIASDSAYIDGTRVDLLSVRLENASSEQKNQAAFFSHEYRFGKMTTDTVYREEDTVLSLNYHGNFSLYQDVRLSRNWRIYDDIPGNFYSQTYMNPSYTRDSIALISGRHQAGVQFFGERDSIRTFRIFAGIINEGKRFHLTDRDDFVQNHYLKAYISDDSRQRFRYKASARYGIAGRRQSDFTSAISLAYHPDSLQHISFNNSLKHEAANYFYEHFASNHFYWNQQLANEKVLKSSLVYRNQSYHFNLRINHALLGDPVYIAASKKPEQFKGNANILGAALGKEFIIGPVGLKTDIVYQHIDQDSILYIPDLLIFAGLYFEHNVFDHNMLLRVGADTRYHSDYPAVTYIPATGFFAPENAETLPESVLVDAYLSFKVKRFRAFIRYNNIGGELLSDAAWSLQHYPERPSAIHFGFSWEFYD
jgi:hypothetical protein